MRSISSAMADILESNGMKLAQLLLITREDGATHAHTSWSESITYGGITYSPVNSVMPTSQSEQLSGIGNLDIVGYLKSPDITEADILADRFDSATIIISVVDPTNLTAGAITQFDGYIGNIQLIDSQWVFEIVDKYNRLKTNIGEIVQPTCRCEYLGDSRCKITRASYQSTKLVDAKSGTSAISFSSLSHVQDYYQYGTIEFLTGDNIGITREIKASGGTSAGVGTGGWIILSADFPFTVDNGDSALLTAGCNRTIGQCETQFANVVNFRGEPYLPGDEQMSQRGI